jgi:hypothetical protein
MQCQSLYKAGPFLPSTGLESQPLRAARLKTPPALCTRKILLSSFTFPSKSAKRLPLVVQNIQHPQAENKLSQNIGWRFQHLRYYFFVFIFRLTQWMFDGSSNLGSRKCYHSPKNLLQAANGAYAAKTRRQTAAFEIRMLCWIEKWGVGRTWWRPAQTPILSYYLLSPWWNWAETMRKVHWVSEWGKM